MKAISQNQLDRFLFNCPVRLRHSIHNIFIALLLICTLAGCGGSGGQTSEPQPQPPAVNNAPSATAASVTTDQNTAVQITLSGTDPDADPLTFALTNQPQNGSLSGTAPNLTYTPKAGYSGNDSFTFTVNDGNLTSEPATVSITVNGTTGHNHHCTMIPDFASENLMTHKAVQSGIWQDAATWGGQVPGNGAIVQIPKNVTVTINSLVSERLETVRVDGSLLFAHDRNTELNVDTLVSTCPGLLQIGTSSQPINANVTAKVTFIDDGPVADTKRLGRGAVLMGTTTIFGAAKTHRAIISPQAKKGDIQLRLLNTPSGWQVNDQLIITGTIMNDPRSDELRTITAIDGSLITLNDYLALNHRAPHPTLNVYVANASRNVEFISENTATLHRGHIMFMSSNVNVQNARFTELGRTDKTRPLNDFEFVPHPDAGDDFASSADVVALGGENRRGRYVIHFHQVGVMPNSPAALVKGNVAFNGPGWGYVNHSSHVNFIDNVAYGLQGAGFYTEAGDEIGTIQGNIAIRTYNPSFVLDDQGAIDPDLGANLIDFGNDGDGFWFTGNRVKVINNVSAGASAHGFIYWTDGIMEPTQPTSVRTTVNVSDIANGHLITNRQTIPVWWAPMAENSGNESYGATVGFRSRYVNSAAYTFENGATAFHQPPPQAYIDTLNPTVSNLTVWGSRDGVLLNYNERMSLKKARIVGFGKDVSVFSPNPGTAKSGIGLDVGNDATHGPAQISDVTIEGFGMGFATPVNSTWQINNVTMRNNATDMYIQPPEPGPAEVIFSNVIYDTFQVIDNQPGVLPPHIIVRN
ncbi:Ig-like domain-containing protein [Pleionea sp. CnH1-48]|uniref:Ig-like domain-containing protein n=1 Tax=Pleionea sp. CnH1-48 TaxID=2954494 RepID=UPI0020968C01|nr:Ig-like domain-containing protein [Pleionea sp. CnH1-48]MCO7223218.1 Ig-like domain-containing protein [Pleionea sp. CnH1-48]